MKQGISFWVQVNIEDGGFVGLTSYSRFFSHCADTELAALAGIIKLTLESLEDTDE